MTDFKDEIRKRMDSSNTSVVFRGTDVNEVAGVLGGDPVTGSKCDIIRGSFDGPPPTNVDRGTPVGELNWADGPNVEYDAVSVTGGFTDKIGETRRFRDNKFGLVIVVDPSKTGLVPIQYDWGWQNDRPGVHCHIRTTSRAEIRVEGEGLYGTCNAPPQADGTRVFRVEEWGAENLSATSSNSMFADENEWVSLTPQVDLENAIDTILSIRTSVSREGAPDQYDSLISRLPPTDVPVVMLSMSDNARVGPDGTHPLNTVRFGYGRDGFIEPNDVEPHLLGVQI